MWWLRNAQTANHTTLAKPEAEAEAFESWFAIICILRAMYLSQ